MSGQRAHRRGSLGGRRVRGAAVRDLGFAFELLEGELELLDLQRELLRGLAKGHAAELRQLVAEGIDQRVAGSESGFALGDPSVFVGAGSSWVRHPDNLPTQATRNQDNTP